MNVVLGKKYHDKVHGYEGVAVARCEHLFGLPRVSLETLHDTPKSVWFEECQLEETDENDGQTPQD